MQKNGTQFPETRQSLIFQLKSGENQQAWQEFVAIYRPVIFRIARRRGLQEADAQDLTQTVLVSISKAIKSWKPRDEKIRFRHWVRKITKNAVLKALARKPKDQAKGGTSVHATLEHHPESEDQLEHEILLEQRREIYFRAATFVKAEIATDTWQIFQLAVVEGIPIETVAKQTGKSVGAAYAARGRVMKRLQQTVQRLEEGLE